MIGGHNHCQDFVEGLAQGIGDGAAYTAIGQRYGIAVMVRDQPGINIDGAEVINQNRQSQAMVAGQQAVDHRGLAGAQITADHGNRYHGSITGA